MMYQHRSWLCIMTLKSARRSWRTPAGNERTGVAVRTLYLHGVIDILFLVRRAVQRYCSFTPKAVGRHCSIERI